MDDVTIINILLCYYIKQADCILPCVCTVLDQIRFHKCGKNISDTLVWLLHTTCSNFEVICDPLMNRHAATCNQFVTYI